MKAFVKLVVEFVGWRWAPAVALLAASMLYVCVVVGLVPSEIGVPVANAKFAAHLTDNQLGSSETTANTYATSTAETTPISAPARQMLRPQSPEFGRRGFSPPLERPEPPPSPSPPPAPVVTNTLPARGPLGGIFSRLQGALHPGSVAAQALTHAAQSPPGSAPPATPPAVMAPPAAMMPPAAMAPPPAANAPAPPAPPAPPEGAASDAPPAEAAPPGAPSVQPVQPPPPPGAAPPAEPAPEPAPAQ